jgi:calcineurin-like phosphoesterase family protein
MKKQKIFMTANTYFGRHKALELPKRKDYSSVHDMNQSMIDSWNKVVGENDLVYHLGYFAHDPNTTNEVLEQLNGNIYFMSNGSDRTIPDIIHLYDYIMLYEGQILEIPNKNSIISYFPLEVWDNEDTLHFYGDERVSTNLEESPNRMNVSFDLWGRPVELDECLEYIEEFKNTQ